MKASELIELLRDVPPDAKIVRPTGRGTVVCAMSIGIVKVVPVNDNPNILPGREWRGCRPSDSIDDIQLHFTIS